MPDKAHRKRGDRRDGTWIKDVTGLQTIMMHLWPKRTDCEVYLNDTFDATELVKYIEKKNAEHPEFHTTMFHCIVTAVARMMHEREGMNRFIQGRRLYQKDEISLSFIAKRRFADYAEESLMVLVPKKTDTLEDISRKIYGDVKQTRERPAAEGIDDVIDQFAKIPRPLLMLVLGAIKRLDFFGMVPKALTEGDTHYTSVLLSNLGSIKCPSVYHHLANYGTNSFIITIGTLHKEEILMEDGHREIRDVIDIGATLDERIGDGFYFARSLKLIKHIMAHPELLDQPIGEPSGFDYNA